MSECAKVKEINQGEKFTMNVRLVKSDGTPFDLTGATQIQAAYENTAEGHVIKDLVAGDIVIDGDAKLGAMIISGTKVDSATFKIATRQTLHIAVDFSATNREIVAIPEAYDVVENPVAFA